MFTQAINGAIASQCDKPRHGGASRCIEGTCPAPDIHENVLKQILGFGAVANHSHDHPKQASGGQPVQFSKSITVFFSDCYQCTVQ